VEKKKGLSSISSSMPWRQSQVTSPVVDLPNWRPVFQSSLHQWLKPHIINSPWLH